MSRKPGVKRHIRGEVDWRKERDRLGRPPHVIHEGRTTRPAVAAPPVKARRRWFRRRSA